MKTISQLITNNIIVTEDSIYNKISVQSVIVESNITVRLYGIIDEVLHLKPGSVAYVHGKLNGTVINDGGAAYIFNPSGFVETFEVNNR